MGKITNFEQSQIAVSAVRFWLYITWLVLALAYFSIFMYLRARVDVPNREADAAIAKILYIIMPVLMAFLAFWFDLNRNEDPGEREMIPSRLVIVAATATVFGHALVFIYLGTAVIAKDFGFPDSYEDGFEATVSQAFHFLALLWTFTTAPAAYFLRKDHIPFQETHPAEE